MKLLKITLLLATLLSSIIACDNPKTTTVTDVTTNDTTTQETAEPVNLKTTPVVEIQGDRTNLEEFWKIVLVAVANKDKETLKQLSKYRAGATWLAEDRYAPLVAKIKATDFKESSRQENGNQMYECGMTMNYPEEELAEGSDGEQPGTTIYIWKKEDGNFEIFKIFEAG